MPSTVTWMPSSAGSHRCSAFSTATRLRVPGEGPGAARYVLKVWSPLTMTLAFPAVIWPCDERIDAEGPDGFRPRSALTGRRAEVEGLVAVDGDSSVPRGDLAVAGVDPASRVLVPPALELGQRGGVAERFLLDRRADSAYGFFIVRT